MTNTIFVGKVYLRFDELPSTNDYARELLAKSRPSEGTVVRADSQSGGRGQYGSQWLSEPGANLTLSVIFYPGFLAVADQFRLSEAVALAVRDTVVTPNPKEEGSGVGLKWPNDIYIGARKTAGILIQNTLTGYHLQSSVVGIGLNVNQLSFPASAPNATSMALAAGHTFDLEAVAETLLQCLERRYLQLRNGQTALLRAEYHAHLLGLGAERQFLLPDGRTLSGTIRGVSDDGRLMLDTPAGLNLFAVKEIQLL